MTQPTPPEPLSPLDQQFFDNWNKLKKHEDAKYVIYGGMAFLAAIAAYIFWLGHLVGLVDLVAAAGLYVWWRWYCSHLAKRHRELNRQREEVRSKASSSPEKPTDD